MAGTRRALSPQRAAARARTAAAARERLRTELAAAVAELRSQHHFHAWLKTCATLPRYSPTNVLLIATQARSRGLDPATAASAATWTKLGYRIRPGETALLIRRPVKTRTTPRTGDRPLGDEPRDPGRAPDATGPGAVSGRRDTAGASAQGTPAADDAPPGATRRVVNFRPGYVFCRAQVEPHPGRTQLPLELPSPPVQGRAFRRELARLDAALQADGWTVHRRSLPPGTGGTCNLERRQITLDTDLDPDAQLRVLVHEAAHGEGVGARTHGRARAECIVESATFIVCARIGLDVTTSSVPYIAGWDADEPGTIERDAAEINRVALAVERRLSEPSVLS